MVIIRKKENESNSAKAVYNNEHDKISNYPDIDNFIIDELLSIK